MPDKFERFSSEGQNSRTAVFTLNQPVTRHSEGVTTMNLNLKTLAVSTSLALGALVSVPAHAGGLFADIGQALGILTPAQAQQAGQGWGMVMGAVPGARAVESAVSSGVHSAVVGAATYYGGPIAPMVGNAIIDQQRAQLEAARRAAQASAQAPAPQMSRPAMSGYPTGQPGYGAPAPSGYGYGGGYGGFNGSGASPAAQPYGYGQRFGGGYQPHRAEGSGRWPMSGYPQASSREGMYQPRAYNPYAGAQSYGR